MTSARRRHGIRILVAGTIVAILVLVAGLPSLVPPLAESCLAGTLAPQACHETVTAALERGLAPFHPLILGATVTPGPAGPTGLGERATVSFSMLGLPGATQVRLFYDIGAHWGGSPDRGAAELAAWSLLPPIALVILIGAGFLVRRRRPGTQARAIA